MNVSETGIELIKKFEGCVLKAYKCPAGVWTIGYGHTAGVKEGQTITKKEAEDLLKHDLITFETHVSNLITVAINQNQFDALVSFCYNLGPGNLKSSTLLKLINAKNFNGAAEQFDRWVYTGGKKLNGLVKRRAAEKALFLQPFNTTRYKVIATVLNVRKKPGINNKILNVLYKNDIIEISETHENWGKLSDKTGWVYLKYLKEITLRA